MRRGRFVIPACHTELSAGSGREQSPGPSRCTLAGLKQPRRRPTFASVCPRAGRGVLLCPMAFGDVRRRSVQFGDVRRNSTAQDVGRGPSPRSPSSGLHPLHVSTASSGSAMIAARRSSSRSVRPENPQPLSWSMPRPVLSFPPGKCSMCQLVARRARCFPQAHVEVRIEHEHTEAHVSAGRLLRDRLENNGKVSYDAAYATLAGADFILDEWEKRSAA